MASFDPARARSSNFCTLPVEVRGSGPKTKLRGTLKPGRCSRQNATSASGVI